MLEFTVLLTLAVFFLSILVSSNDLMVMFISIIGFSLNMYVLLMSDFDRRASLEAGIKYFYLSAFSSGLLISGIWLSYIIFFSTHFTDIRLILDN
ncbi:MAG: proton-conducting transporter transmembrane domain-containing protein [Nitrososphaeraceae archaeon]